LRSGIPVAAFTGMGKPYDIKERAFLFSCDAMLAYPNEALDPLAHLHGSNF
jgi:hypothetical protein